MAAGAQITEIGDLAARRSEMRCVDEVLNAVAGHLNAQHGRLIDIAVWLLDHRAHWSGEGVWKPEQYLAWRCGIGQSTASKIVALAERADELPETIAAVRAGELSLDQAAPIAKRVPSWADAKVVSLAKRLTVRQIQRTVAAYPFGENPTAGADVGAGAEPDAGSAETAEEGQEADAAEEERDAGSPGADGHEAGSGSGDTAGSPTPISPDDRCWYGVGDDGRWRLFVEASRDVGDLVATALDEARDALFHRDSGEPAEVTALDALVEVAQRSLDTVDTPSRRDRHRVHVHLRTDGPAVDHLGIPLPDVVRRHLTCDGTIIPTFLDGAIPISVGRSERIVPDRTRRVVLLRDGGCRVPGCAAEHHLEIHHIVHWTDGGPTDTWNLVALCPRHHRLHHQGRLGITGNADEPEGLRFTLGDGRPLRSSGANPELPTGPPEPISGTYQHPLGERLDGRYVTFHPPPASVWPGAAAS